MAKFLYSAAMSLDGFIAGPGGDMSWMTDYIGPNPVVDELISETGALLVGNRTSAAAGKGQEGEGEAFGGGWEGPQFVLTHHPPAEKFVNILGASVAAQCLEAGALDEVMLSVLPVLLGDGTRVFEHEGGKTVRLKPVSVTHTPHVTNLRFRVTA